MKALVAILTALAVPLLLMNLLGGVVSGIWLALIGQWGAIGYGLLLMLLGSFILSVAMLPGLIFAAPALYFQRHDNRIGMCIVGLLSVSYTAAVIGAWCTTILLLFAQRATSLSSLLALLIWSYGVALAPLIWMSKKEADGGNDASSTTTFAAQISYVVVLVLVPTLRLSSFAAFGIVAGFTLVVAAAQMLAALGTQGRSPESSPAGSAA